MHTQPAEDIHAIVNRFQAWTGAQAPVSRKDEVRELTYEEAIQASRAASSEKIAPLASPESQKRESQELEDEAAKRSRRGTTAHGRQQEKAGQPRQRSVNLSRVHSGEPAFRQVLSESMAAASISARQSTATVYRQAALTIRVSAKEQALIKARAVAANLSVSAYLRQCALEVEPLRMQLQQLSAANRAILMAPQSSAIALPGFLTRFTRWFFSRKAATFAVRA